MLITFCVSLWGREESQGSRLGEQENKATMK